MSLLIIPRWHSQMSVWFEEKERELDFVFWLIIISLACRRVDDALRPVLSYADCYIHKPRLFSYTCNLIYLVLFVFNYICAVNMVTRCLVVYFVPFWIYCESSVTLPCHIRLHLSALCSHYEGIILLMTWHCPGGGGGQFTGSYVSMGWDIFI